MRQDTRQDMRRIALTLLLSSIVPLSASADWLVMKDGARVETRGEWKVKGKIVVFTLPNGTLSSVRLSEVDLDRSAEATYEAENARAEDEESAEETPKGAVIEITDDDIPRAAAAPRRGAQGGAGEEGEAEGSGAAAGKEDVTINEPFELLAWDVRPRERGLEIVGTLAYRGEEEIVEGLNMIVSVRNSEGLVLAETSAALRTRMLRTGAATSFRAVFADLGTEEYEITVEVESQSPQF